jgi:protein TonB
LPRRPASPRTQSPAIPEPEPAAKAPVARAKPPPRKKATPPPVRDPTVGRGAPRPPSKPRVARSIAAAPAAAVAAPAAAVVARAAAPKAARRPPAPKPKVVPALVAVNSGAAVAAPVWIPAFRDERADRLFTYALGISILIHAVALAIRFQPFDLQKMFDRGPPLEVALVNAKSMTKPTKADILAQANLDGGGNTDANRRAKTPLPVLPKDSPTAELTVATQRVETLEKQTKELLTSLRSAPTAPAVPKSTEASEPSDLPTASELMQRTLEAMRLEAQIAKDMDAYQKRPKRRFIGARAEEYRFARYVEDWRLKIERIGNLNYPAAAREMKLYGDLLLTVSIRADGSIEGVQVNRSSGQRVLDAAAVHIVEMSAPFAPFPPDVKRDTDILHITRTWTFTKGDELRSE